MNHLLDARLYSHDLVSVSSPALVTRYNEALEALGIGATALSSFHLDGVGWSPEIAEEKGEQHYLAHGMANEFAVIVTPDQARSPLYAPLASFDRALMAAYYARFTKEIADVTQAAPLWLEFDQGFSHYASPQNLLLIERVRVRSSAHALGGAAQEQARLVAQFQNDPLAWFDPELRRRIMVSAHRHGDLRDRQLAIPELEFTDVQNFYTPAFGGVFVLRAKSGNSYLVLQDETEFEAMTSKRNAVYLRDPELLEHLQAEALIDLDLVAYSENLAPLQDKLEYLLADLLFQNDPDLDLTALTPPQRKARLQRLGEGVPDMLLELEYLIGKLGRGECVRPSQLSNELVLLLLHPHADVQGQQREVVWRLLTRLEPTDLAGRYRWDKEGFIADYRTWSDAKKRWAVAQLTS